VDNSEVIMLVGGVIAAILGGVGIARSNLQSLTDWGVLVLGVTLVLLALV
jgi:hypothetical protein